MAKHLILGQQGEEIARKYLEEKGFRILAQNWRFKHKEIDFIALDRGFLAIIEVKTRSSTAFGGAEDFITYRKVTFLADAANAYVEKLDGNVEVRFDIITIILMGKEPIIEHMEGAFQP